MQGTRISKEVFVAPVRYPEKILHNSNLFLFTTVPKLDNVAKSTIITRTMYSDTSSGRCTAVDSIKTDINQIICLIQ